MPAKVLPTDLLQAWTNQGLGPKAIVARLRDEHGIVVTESAISMWRSRQRQVEPLRPRYDELIPWKVEPPHRNSYAAKMLRLEARRRLGQEIDPIYEAKLDRFLERLERERVVVHYDGRTDDGWFFVPREPRDTDIIREPSLKTAEK